MPNAPQPVYDSHGNLVAAWTVSARFVPSEDVIIVHWTQDAGPYQAAKAKSRQYSVEDVEDVAAALQHAVRILGARRLF